jgi:hypothetical protein
MMQADDLYAEVTELKSEKRSLQTKVGEVESGKEALLYILAKIRRETDACDLYDGESLELDERMLSLGNSM